MLSFRIMSGKTSSWSFFLTRFLAGLMDFFLELLGGQFKLLQVEAPPGGGDLREFQHTPVINTQ